ncbi:type VII secretion-associated serine protease mycosin [Amycolatopsis samaneae]|uniref:Type VII secretion-associated serine protease mycosin n=1 Tax=Amycolatopsis samaneae TaxID=664691 RepID=A0ABW5GEB2_9PSEU
MVVARNDGQPRRRFGRAGRTATVALVASIGALSPMMAIPVWAQQPSVPPASGGYYAAPPPVDPSALPADSGKPDENYVQTKQCVQRSLGKNIVPKNRPWGQEYLQIDKLHEIVKAAAQDHSVGGGQKVAVIDTGVTKHPWLKSVESGGDYVANPKNGVAPGLEDCDGHGTEVAGIIAANTPEDIGFKGVAPDATILSIRQSSQNYGKDTKASAPSSPPASPPASSGAPPSSGGASKSQLPPSNGGGSGQGVLPGDATWPEQKGTGREQEAAGTAGKLTTLAQAVVRAVNQKATVINMSVDNCRTSDGRISDGERQLQAAVHYAVQHNVVVVAAAGNTTDTCLQNDQTNPNQPRSIVTPPWFSEDVISVAAIDVTGGVANFSVNGPWTTVAAPGTDIISLDPAAGSGGLANLTIEGNGEPAAIQGTSFAAPYVAGVAALVRAKYPQLDAKAVMRRIVNTAQRPAAPGGHDNFVGHGVIDPMAALTASVSSEEGVPSVRPVQQVATLPPANNRDESAIIIALAGTGGGLVALLITLFVMHTIRRNRSGGANR